jgi:hypothetical protein
MKSNWYPEIMYEESEDGISSKIPFILVPKEENMPDVVFIFESRESGEFEPGLEGEPVPIIDMNLYQYANMKILKKGLSPDVYDQVRHCLGLKPLSEATEAGKKITEKVRKNIEEKSPTT